MTRESFLNLVGKFTWNFGNKFYIETKIGNFVWSDPDYNGNNTIVSTEIPVSEYFKPHFGRDKGKHVIKNYLGVFGNDVILNFDLDNEV